MPRLRSAQRAVVTKALADLSKSEMTKIAGVVSIVNGLEKIIPHLDNGQVGLGVPVLCRKSERA